MIFYHGTTVNIEPILKNGLLSSAILGLGANDGHHSLPYFHLTKDRVYFTDKIEIAFMYAKLGGLNGHILTLDIPFKINGDEIEYYVMDKIPPEYIIKAERCDLVAERESGLTIEQIDSDFYESLWSSLKTNNI